MRFDLNSWEEIFITLARDKSRSLLTAFGVFWGIFMLIVLIGLGNGLKGFMSRNFEGVAHNTSFLSSNRTSLPYKGFQKGRTWNLQNKDLGLLLKIDGIEKVCPVVFRWGSSVFYNELTSKGFIINGTLPVYAELETQDLAYGRFINAIDVSENRKVCVIGEQVYNDLFKGTGDPTGKSIGIEGVYYQVIGVLNASNSNVNIGGNSRQKVFMPLSTMQNIYNERDKINIIMLGGSPGAVMSKLQPEVEQVIKAANSINPDDKQAVFFLNTEALFGMVTNLQMGINILIWLVGLGTLFAGIIGVSNIMMVTVKERTTEFGIRRAIGALPQDVLGQIILESIVITILAGTVGLLLAVLTLSGVESIINQAQTAPINFQVSFGLAIGTFIILMLLGVFAGLAPAYRALAIKPIDAIREE